MPSYTLTESSVVFNNNFNKKLDEYLNILLQKQELVFGTKFNKAINDDIPENVKKIIFGFDFNRIIDLLHDGVEHIELENHFNKDIKKFPRHLKFLKVVRNMNRKICEFPEGLIELHFSEFRNNPIVYPENLNTLYLRFFRLNSYNFYLPKNLMKLILTINENFELKYLPKSLKYLSITKDYESDETQKDVYEGFNNSIENLPENLEFLSVKADFNLQIPILPKNLKTLVLGHHFNQELNNLPDNLQSITLLNSFNQKLTNLPVNLESLSLGRSFNLQLTGLPQNLKCLKILNSNYSHSIEIIPPSIKELHIQSSPITFLPPNLEKLVYNSICPVFNENTKEIARNLKEFYVFSRVRDIKEYIYNLF